MEPTPLTQRPSSAQLPTLPRLRSLHRLECSTAAEKDDSTAFLLPFKLIQPLHRRRRAQTSPQAQVCNGYLRYLPRLPYLARRRSTPGSKRMNGDGKRHGPVHIRVVLIPNPAHEESCLLLSPHTRLSNLGCMYVCSQVIPRTTTAPSYVSYIP